MEPLTELPAREPLEMACPHCGHLARRVPREPLDRLMSLFGRLRRFRCQSRLCGWEGALRERDLA